MKLKTCTNHSIIIHGKTKDDFSWREKIDEIIVPGKIAFITTGIPKNIDIIKKISWDFGDDSKVLTVTNRKIAPHETQLEHIYRVSAEKVSTLTVQASVYTPDVIFITPMFLIESIRSKNANNYINPAEFKAQIIQYYTDNDLTDILADSVQKIANRLAYATNFINYTYREEMVGDALVKMLEALREHKYIPTKGNPFSYFTKIAFHAFCNRIKKEKKARKALEELQNETYEKMMGEGTIPYQGAAPKSVMDFDDQNSGEHIE